MAPRRLGSAAFGICLLALSLWPGAVLAAAGDAPGPQLSFIRLGWKPETSEIRIGDGLGAGAERLLGGRPAAGVLPYPYSDLAWLPAGDGLVFAGAPGLLYRPLLPERQRLYVRNLASGGLRAIPGTLGARQPVVAPDGDRIAFVRLQRRPRQGRNYRSSVWMVRLDGSGLRRIRPWRWDGGEEPASFAPDGRTLLLGRGQGHLLVLRLGEGTVTEIATRVWDATFSPDGTRIAMIRLDPEDPEDWYDGEGPEIDADLFVISVDGTEETQLTETRAMETSPNWDPSGQRLVFKRRSNLEKERAEMDFGDAIYEVNPDGSCLTKVLSAPGKAYLEPTWRPGPGRAAGPITC